MSRAVGPPRPTVASFNLTPVKSTALHDPDAIELRREGAVGDRRFLFTRTDGSRLTGVSKAPLMPIVAAWDVASERLTMRFPDGAAAEGSTRPTGSAIEVKLFDRTVSARRVDGVFGEAIRERCDETLELFRVDEPETAGGRHRVSILSRASVVDVGARRGEPRLDPRRFRMLIEIDGIGPYGEDGWEGRRVRIGDAVVRVVDRVPRCLMTTLGPDTGAKDFDTLDVLAGYRRLGNDLVLGVYADVERPGIVGRGAAVEILD